MESIKKIKGKHVSTFKDGGTKRVLGEDNNEYYIDNRINSKTKGKIYDRHPSLLGAKQLNLEIEIEN